MQLDSGRLKDLQFLSEKLKKANTREERDKIKHAINEIKRQAQNKELTKDRELLLNARRKTVNTKGTDNIHKARAEADNLEGYIHNKYL